MLTDRDTYLIDANEDELVEFTNLYYSKAMSGISADELSSWYWDVQYGMNRSPLELIAHVVENDLDYREILTADYIMANPQAAQAYGASTEFHDPNDVQEFRPSEIVSYYRDDESKVSESSPEFGTHVIDPGNLATDYPHAGILNTKVFLHRYPSTATNRNRARSRWTYYHFLGVDIEKSASRTTDPVALADTNNPTMHNPACTVCHTVMDPVAGAFQNYGDDGSYRDQAGGMDSLDWFYKERYVSSRTTIEITARSLRNAQTISIWASLKAGTEMISLSPAFDSTDKESDEIWWNMGIDRIRVLNENGSVVYAANVETLGLECGRDEPIQDAETGEQYYEAWYCPQEIPIEVPASGRFEVQVNLFEHARHEDVLEERRLVTVSAGRYQTGETWYRDMRAPGFDGQLAPNSDNSLQWLAHRIVASDRFAEAAVKFWWPAIMGDDIAEPPADEGDIGFEGLLLASNAQSGEVKRLADGFRSGFNGRARYNLRDLLVEIVLSRWFRAESVSDEDAVRATALAGVGARRLLTPEELDNKTRAITGFQWGGSRGYWSPWNEGQHNLTDVNAYRLIYGGIDSDGITERARDFTSLMAGVAQSHAVQSSYPIVMRDLYLLPEEDRLLFAGVDVSVSPAFELAGTFEIEAPSRTDKETVSLMGSLSAGTKNVRLTYVNDFYDDELGDRNIHVDRLRVLTASGSVVGTWEMEDVEPVEKWCEPLSDSFWLAVNCSVDISIEVPSDGEYALEIVVGADHAGDELPRLQVDVESDAPTSAGANRIRAKLVGLIEKLHGIEVTADSPEVQDAYELFVEVWKRKRAAYPGSFTWNEENIQIFWWRYRHFFDGILDDVSAWDEGGDWHWDRVDAHFDTVDWSDPHAVARTWTVVLAYLMMDYRYLYL